MTTDLDSPRSLGVARAKKHRLDKTPKQPGANDWRRADWCSWQAGLLLKKMVAAKAAGELQKAGQLRYSAIKLLSEFRKCRRAAYYEGFQPRSPRGRDEAAKVEASMTELERARMHQRQDRWRWQLEEMGVKVPKWIREKAVTEKEFEMLWNIDHPGRPLP